MVTYADLQVEWQEFLAAADQKWRTYSPDEQVSDEHSLAILRMRKQTIWKDSTLALLGRLSFAKCSVPHDFIGGLLAIQTNENELHIPFQVCQLPVEQMHVESAIQAVLRGLRFRDSGLLRNGSKVTSGINSQIRETHRHRGYPTGDI